MAKPKIRFKGYTDDWEQRKLGEIAIEILAGGDIDKEKVVDDGTYPIYANALTNDGIVGYYNDYYRVKAPAVTVTGRGEVGHAQARMTDFTPVVRLLAIRSNHDCYFLENAINNQNVVVESTGVPQLTVPQLSSYDICFPKDIREEEKIGAYYKKLDNLITLHQRKCEETKKLKKYMLQKMFPQNGQTVPEIRFAGFTDAWEQRKLGETCKLNGRIGFRGYTERDIVTKEAGGVLTFSPTNIVNNKLTMECKNTYITREKYDESPEIKIANGDILFVKTGSTLGKSALVTGLKEDASINPQIVVVRVEKDSEIFMSNVLITHGIMKQVAAVKIGGAVPTMTETELKNLTYFAPVKKEEQKKIGDYFTNLDHFITLHQCKCRVLPKLLYNDWEQRKLEDLVDRVTRKNQDLVSELPLTISAQYGLIDQNEFFDKRVASKDVSGYYLIENGEFAYNKSTSTDAPWGAVKRLDRYENGVLSTLYIVFGIKKNNPVDSDFLVSYYSTNLWHKGIHEIAAEGARNHGLLNIAPADFFETELTIPQDIEEQKKIGKYFEELERLITLHQHKCEQLQSMKKFMLQNMFV